MKVLYFAWLRSRVGTGEESLAPPTSVATVSQLLDWLAARSPGHAEALRDRAVVRVAVNQEFAGPETPVAANDEVALFPPMTGGGKAAFLVGRRASCEGTPSGMSCDSTPSGMTCDSTPSGVTRDGGDAP